MAKRQNVIFRDAFGARLVARPHMLRPDKMVLLIAPLPLEVTKKELIEIANKFLEMCAKW